MQFFVAQHSWQKSSCKSLPKELEKAARYDHDISRLNMTKSRGQVSFFFFAWSYWSVTLLTSYDEFSPIQSCKPPSLMNKSVVKVCQQIPDDTSTMAGLANVPLFEGFWKRICWIYIYNNISGRWFGVFLVFHILGISSSQLTLIFFRGLKPPSRYIIIIF